MDKERQLIVKTERMIDDLKAVCGEYGLSNTGNEYKIIADSFLYKYLNDKFLYEFKRVDKNLSKASATKEVEEEIMKLTPAEMSKYRYGLGANVAFVRKEFLVSYLFNNKNSTTPKFYELFDNALDGISNDNINIFSVRTGSKEKIKLFSPISQYIIELLLISILAFGGSYFSSKVISQNIGNTIVAQASKQAVQDVQSGFGGFSLGNDVNSSLATRTVDEIDVKVDVEELIYVYVIGTVIIILSVMASSVSIIRLKPKEILSKMS